MLRATLTTFGTELAGRIAAPWRVVSAADAAEPFVTLLRRLGRADEQRITYVDGRSGPTWAEVPGPAIWGWLRAPETAAVLATDATGPVAMMFLRRLATTIEVMERFGDGPELGITVTERPTGERQ